jgi:hypothetical protein
MWCIKNKTVNRKNFVFCSKKNTSIQFADIFHISLVEEVKRKISKNKVHDSWIFKKKIESWECDNKRWIMSSKQKSNQNSADFHGKHIFGGLHTIVMRYKIIELFKKANLK